jgi:hypothetical protein
MLKVLKTFSFAYRGIHVVEHVEGAELADDDACAKVALGEQWVKQVKGKPAAAPDPRAERPEGAELTEAITAAIAKLDPDEDFTSKGLPSVPALEKKLGYQITSAERNAAWASIG